MGKGRVMGEERERTKHTYVVASMCQLYHSPALETPPPIILIGHTKKIDCCRVFGAFILVRWALTDGASLALALDTCGHLIFDELRGDKC